MASITEVDEAFGGELCKEWRGLEYSVHYGVMLYEQMDEEHVASAASVWLEYPKYTELARQAFRRSVE